MELKDQVCSLESARRLKELGIKQESLWYFDLKGNLTDAIDTGYYGGRTPPKEAGYYSAFTVVELVEYLPETIEFKGNQYALYIMKQKVIIDDWFVFYFNEKANDRIHTASNRLLIESVSQMLIYLLESNLSTVKDK